MAWSGRSTSTSPTCARSWSRCQPGRATCRRSTASATGLVSLAEGLRPMTMLHSLRIRLILVLILVTLVPVATVSILMLRATAEAFRSYAEERSLLDAQSIVEQVGGETGSQVFVVGSEV